MRLKWIKWIWLFLLVLFVQNTHLAIAQVRLLTESFIKQRLQQAVDKEHLAPGIVAGFVDEQGSRVEAYGTCRSGAKKPVNGDTLFEIGSITKVFTALLLQDMVDRGEVKLEDPIGKFLPVGLTTPSRNGKQITLIDLATHSSGLPRIPSNMSLWYLMRHFRNPYAKYGPDKLYKFLSDYSLPRNVGDQFEYSNLGMGLLGHILSLRSGMDYESLVINRICKPLKMDSTRIVLSPELKTRLASGHNWDFQVLEGCGALRSSVNDLLKFLSANMGLTATPLSAAMQKIQVPLRDGFPGDKIGLVWWIAPSGIISHNGATGSYRSFIGFDPHSRRGIVVLANSNNDAVISLASWLLNPVFVPASNKNKPVDFSVNGRQYRYVTEIPLKWKKAEKQCQSNKGWHLTVLRDQNQFDQIIQAIRSNIGGGVWIGARDAGKAGKWSWVTGEPFSFAPWLPGEPNNMGREIEAGITTNWWADNSIIGMNNFDDKALPYLCEGPAPSSDILDDKK
jgi:serine-type D-Ala-D-Ala carboxypeptidase/endopeptidase